MRTITYLVAIFCVLVVVAGRFVSPSAPSSASSAQSESLEFDVKDGWKPGQLSRLQGGGVENPDGVPGEGATDHDGNVRVSGRTDADRIHQKHGTAARSFPHETRPRRLRRRLSAEDSSSESRDRSIAARRKVRRNRPDLSPANGGHEYESEPEGENIFRAEAFGAPHHHERPRKFSPVGSQARANMEARPHAEVRAGAHEAPTVPARAVAQHVAPEIVLEPRSIDRPAAENSHYARDPIVVATSSAAAGSAGRCNKKSCCLALSSLDEKRSCCDELRAGYNWTSGRCRKVPCTNKTCCMYRNRQAKRKGRTFRMAKCCNTLEGWQWKRIRGRGKCVRASRSPGSPSGTIPSPTPPSTTSSPPLPTGPGLSISNPNKGAIGASCQVDEDCLSSTCVMETCREGRLVDRAECSVARDCDSGSCANFALASSTERVCCPGGQYFQLDGSAYCAQGPEGALCSEGWHCASATCIMGTCREGRLADRAACSIDGDCESGKCASFALASSADRMCCPGGQHFQIDGRTYCAQGPEGARCADDWHCRSGSSCALADYSPDAAQVCCSSSDVMQFVQINQGGDGTTGPTANYCTGIVKDGGYCGFNAQCQSDVCVDKTCQPGKLEATGPCDEPSDCLNSACGLWSYTSQVGKGKVCCPSGDTITGNAPGDGDKEEEEGGGVATEVYCTGQPMRSPCHSAAMCASNENGESACALEEYSASANRVCCPSGRSVLVRPLIARDCIEYTITDGEGNTDKAMLCFDIAGNALDLDEYCTGMESGMACRINDQCSSGVCVGGRCMDSPGGPWSSCDEDADCAGEGGTCGKGSYDADASDVCCPATSEAVDLPKAGSVEGGSEIHRYCTSLPPNAPCYNDDMCGVVDERTGRQSACGLEEYVTGARRVCCPGGEAVRVFRPGSDFESDNYCAGLDAGKACGRDVLCLSGSCVEGVCA